MQDKEKITKSLMALSRLKFVQNRTLYTDGLANLAETIIGLINAHGNSSEYRYSLQTLLEQARNAEKIK